MAFPCLFMLFRQTPLPPPPEHPPVHTSLSAAGTHLYNVGTLTPRFSAISFGGVPAANSFFAASTLRSVIFRGRPPTRPRSLAASNPALVRSTISLKFPRIFEPETARK